MKEIEFLCKQNGQRLRVNPSPLNSVDNITSFLYAILYKDIYTYLSLQNHNKVDSCKLAPKS